MRIHIGQISPALAERIGELEQRIDRFGTRTSPLSLHKKEYGTFYFAFVDMDIDKRQYGALCTALNGVTFRQSKLEIKQAKPTYLEKMQFGKQQHELVPKHNPEQLKRLRQRSKRQIDVLPGREFTGAPRLEPTFRVLIKGELRKPKMRKRKLWGIEKRPLDRLAHHFVDGEWRDIEGRAIEIVETLHDEQAKARKIAEELAKSSAYLSDSDFEEFLENAKDIGNADSDNEIEIVPHQTTGLQHAPLNESSDDDEMEVENGQYESDNYNDNTKDTCTNTTESLRSALTVEKPFTLFGEPSLETEQATTAAPVVPIAAPVSEPKVGLFFLHEKSPYLRSQTQAAKLIDEFDAKAWETEFFENRGEWNRNLRKRRRDAHRMSRRMGKKRGEQ